MPDMNQKLERFRQLVLEDAQKERGKIMDDVDRQRRQRRLAQESQQSRPRCVAKNSSFRISKLVRTHNIIT